MLNDRVATALAILVGIHIVGYAQLFYGQTIIIKMLTKLLQAKSLAASLGETTRPNHELLNRVMARQEPVTRPSTEDLAVSPSDVTDAIPRNVNIPAEFQHPATLAERVAAPIVSPPPPPIEGAGFPIEMIEIQPIIYAAPDR